MISSHNPTIAPRRLHARGITSRLRRARTRYGRDTRARAHGRGGSTTRRALSLLLLVGLCMLPMSAHELAVGFTGFPVATGLTGPTAAEATGDGRLFVGQQDGGIRVIKDDALLAEPFAALSVESSGERGMLGITLDPAFDSNQFTNESQAPQGLISSPAAAVEIAAGEIVDLAGAATDGDGPPFTYHWGFGEGSGVADADVANRGPLAFSTPEAYTVTLAVTDASGATDPEPATVRGVVRALAQTPIPHDEWGIWFVDSEEVYAGDFSATNAIDNDPTTIWHTAYRGSPPPHDIQIDLRRMYALGGLRYLPRTDGSRNGRVAQYEVYVSADGANWGDPVATGSFLNSRGGQEALFATTATGRYVRFRALDEVNGNPWTSVAELDVLGELLPPEGELLPAEGELLPAEGTLALHASNKHYLQLDGRPTIVIGSGEHYGALINLDFDYAEYFATLGRGRLNHTRLWMGPYRETSGHFGIFDNTLAPAPGRWIVPWARSATPGGPDGNKFDLDRWDPAYFARLHSLIAAAAANDVVVEINLFCVYYEEDMWDQSPFNPNNNVNGATGANRSNALSVSNGGLIEYQRSYVEKLVSELNGFDNIYFEIVNEPYTGSMASDEFQSGVVQWIVETEASLPKKHLIAVNGPWATAAQPHGAVSIYSMHYAAPGEISGSLGFDGVIGSNETGFQGTSDDTYRKEAWHYLLHGAGLYSMLDFSFHVGFEDGTFVNSTRSGGGSKALRDQLVVLKQFIETFDFVRMAPDTTVVESGAPQLWSAFSEPGEQYAIFLDGGHSATLSLALPAGAYWAEWVDTRTGSVMKSEAFAHTMGSHSLVAPPYSQDIALRIKRE